MSAIFRIGLGLFLLLGVSACSTPKRSAPPALPPDAAYTRVSGSARAAFERGDPERAAVLYAEALDRARVMDRPTEIGTSAYNLGLSKMAMGHAAEARAPLREARDELWRAGESAMDARIALAEAAAQMGDDTEARASVDEALTALESVASPDARVQLLTLRASLTLRAGQRAEAEADLDAAQKAVTRKTPSVLLARLAGVRGLSFSAVQDYAQAADVHDREAELYQLATRYVDMAFALGRAATAYAASGDAETALDRAYRGARSLAASGRTVEALKLIDTHKDELGAPGTEKIADRMADWLVELRAEVNRQAAERVKEPVNGENGL